MLVGVLVVVVAVPRPQVVLLDGGKSLQTVSGLRALFHLGRSNH